MGKKIVIGIISIFVVLNVLLLFFTFHPDILAPLWPTIGKDQVYYWQNQPYPLGSYLLPTDNSRFIFVGKLLDVYKSKDDYVYAKVQLTKDPNTVQTIALDLPNASMHLIVHPIDQLIGIFAQSTNLNLNTSNIVYNFSKFKNQNMVFYAPLPNVLNIPFPQDEKTKLLLQKPAVIKLMDEQKKGIYCNAQLLSAFQQKKQQQMLTCIPLVPEVHVNTGVWKKL